MQKRHRIGAFLSSVIKCVEPIAFKIIDEEDYAAKAPCKGICPVNRFYNRIETHRNGYIRNSNKTPAYKHCVHRHFCSSCTAHNRRNRMCKSKSKKEDGFRSHLVNADFHNGRVAVKKRNYPRTDNPEYCTKSLRGNH